MNEPIFLDLGDGEFLSMNNVVYIRPANPIKNPICDKDEQDGDLKVWTNDDGDTLVFDGMQARII